MNGFKEWVGRRKFKEIFEKFWEPFKKKFPRYQDVRYDEVVKKMLGCGNPENGFSTYICCRCGGDKKKVPFSCKSSFCLSCAKVYIDNWVARIEAVLFEEVPYRHVVLTVPEDLRIYFYRQASLLSDLIRVGVACLEDLLNTVLRMEVQAGYIVVLQTNGRSGSYNPHLHFIMTSGGIAQSRKGSDKWVHLKYFPYEILHKKWQYYLFTMLKEKVNTSEMKGKIDELYKKYLNGLVAHVQKGQVPKKINNLAKYLAKYVVSPPISIRRIVYYDGKMVKYWYNDHYTGKKKTERVGVFTFIGRMVQHILPKGMQRIRYYGLHGTAVYKKVCKKLTCIFKKALRVLKDTFCIKKRTYRERVIESTHRDPFICSKCGGEIILWKVWHPQYGVIYDEEEKLRKGVYDGDESGRDRDVRNQSNALLQLSMQELWV
jgi:hypothetical protein